MPERYSAPEDAREGLALSKSAVDVGFATATQAQGTWLTDANKSWPVDMLAGFVIEILTGDQAGDRRLIRNNDATVIRPTTNFSGAIAIGDLYVITPGLPPGHASITVRSASGALSAAETSTPVTGLGWAKYAVVRLDVTTITTPDGDDEIDFYLQTSYNAGGDWVDLENIHFATADNGNTAIRLLVVTPQRPTAADVAETETDGTLADNTKLDLPLGDRLRISVVLTGASAPTYAYNAEGSVKG